MCVAIVILLVLAFLPYINIVVAIFFSLLIRNYKLLLGAIILFVLYVFIVRLEKKQNEEYLQEFYKVTDSRNLEFFPSYDTFLTYYPKYSLMDTDLDDGYHEKKVTQKGKDEIHKITVKYGEYVSYYITNKNGDTLKNQKQFLHNQQLVNYKSDYPNKKVIIGYKVDYKGFLWYIKQIMYVLCIITAFYSYYLSGDHEYVESLKGKINTIKPKRSKDEMILEAEEVLDEGLDTILLDEDEEEATSNSYNVVDINNATEENFADLQGISSIQAKYIVQEREEQGDYLSLEDFFERNEMSENIIENIRHKLFCNERTKKKKSTNTSKNTRKNKETRNRGRRLDL